MPHWRRRSRNYGRERARGHIAEAWAFSHEVAGTDEIVKKTFFSLSGKALEDLLDRYGARYGASARAYAAQTIPKWRSGKVQMGGMVARRLFDLLPPFMPAADKNRIVDSIWRTKGPRSHSYLYVGPDSDPEKVVMALEVYFDHLDVQYPLPHELRAQFKWLAQDDASAQERMLNHFMARQRELALQSARLHVPVLVESIKGDPQEQIERLTHTISVGNHVVEIRADRYRIGFEFSSSASYTSAPFKMTPAGWAAVAAIVGGLILYGILNTSPPISTVQSAAAPAAAAQAVAAPAAAHVIVHTAAPPVIFNTAPPLIRSASTRAHAVYRHPVAVPANNASVRSNASLIAVRQTMASGCVQHRIAWSAPDGSAVVTSDGAEYTISDEVEQMIAARWVTDQPVTACSEGDGVVLHMSFDKVSARPAGTVAVEDGSCRQLYVAYAAADGSAISATDGSTFAVGNTVQQIVAARWITGDSTEVCTMRVKGIWRASLAQNLDHVQATMTVVGTGSALAPPCSSQHVASNESGGIRLSDGVYHVDNEVMQMLAEHLSDGDATVCVFEHHSVRYIGVAISFDRIEAERSI